ncbi:MAG TPA: glutathione S-transferase N-terminal domain-containing protein [Hyphomicrobiaceae bacterium]|nr:glutathione S-transferase N-terminal domain-containing protein [Hyphomicrobiaceae bacterium]
MLEIYGRANSINVRKVLWMCAELGLPYTRSDWGRGYRATSEAEFRQVSDFGVVPVVVDDGFVLRESNTIVRYLAAKHGRADLYPADLKSRATIEQWMDWASTDLYQSVRPVFLGLVVKMAPFKDQPDVIQSAGRDWNGQMQRLDRHLADSGPYVAGATFTIADIPVGLVVNRWASIAFDKPKLEAVSAYYERLSQRTAYREHGRNGTP